MLGDRGPAGVRVFDPVPTSDPFADAAELGAPPARAELREYIEDTDMRLVSNSGIEGLARSAASGSWYVASSFVPMLPADIFGVSSTPKSSPLAFRSSPGLQPSIPPVIDDARLFTLRTD